MSRQEATRLVLLEGNLTLEIINELYNPLINRREIQGRLHHPGMGTPKIPDLRVAIAKALGVDFKLLFIRKLVTETGLNTSKILVHIYKTVSDATEYEPKHVKEKNKTLAEEIEEAEKEEQKKKGS